VVRPSSATQDVAPGGKLLPLLRSLQPVLVVVVVVLPVAVVVLLRVGARCQRRLAGRPARRSGRISKRNGSGGGDNVGSPAGVDRTETNQRMESQDNVPTERPIDGYRKRPGESANRQLDTERRRRVVLL
jgi:hypothetical protein